jgi:hypothetical protein
MILVSAARRDIWACPVTTTGPGSSALAFVSRRAALSAWSSVVPPRKPVLRRTLQRGPAAPVPGPAHPS